MANLTSKELDALEDQLNFEHTCVCKYQAAAQETTETALRSFAAQAGLESLGDWAAPADSPYGCALYSTNGGALITASTHPYTYQDYVGAAPVSSDRWYYSLTLQLRTEDQLPG